MNQIHLLFLLPIESNELKQIQDTPGIVHSPAQSDLESKAKPKFDPFSCTICKQTFSQPMDLAKHFENIHLSNIKTENELNDNAINNDEKINKKCCKYCKKEFNRPSDARRHENR